MMGLSELLAIHQRSVQVGNDQLAQRQDEASEIVENCRAWSRLLMQMLSEAAAAWSASGQDAAQAVVRKQMDDLLEVDYFSLHRDSVILRHLGEDDRFHPFVAAAHGFYDGALELKRIAHGAFGESDGPTVSDALDNLRHKLEGLFESVVREGHRVRILEPR